MIDLKPRGARGYNPRGITFCVVAHRLILCALAIALRLVGVQHVARHRPAAVRAS